VTFFIANSVASIIPAGPPPTMQQETSLTSPICRWVDFFSDSVCIVISAAAFAVKLPIGFLRKLSRIGVFE